MTSSNGIIFRVTTCLAICAGNSPVPGEFPAQRQVTRKFYVFFDLRPNNLSSKQWWGWWFQTLSRPLWRHRNEYVSRRITQKMPTLCKIQRPPSAVYVFCETIQDSRFKNGLLQFQQKSTWYTFQDWSPGGRICPKYNQIELHNIDLFGTTG